MPEQKKSIKIPEIRKLLPTFRELKPELAQKIKKQRIPKNAAIIIKAPINMPRSRVKDLSKKDKVLEGGKIP